MSQLSPRLPGYDSLLTSVGWSSGRPVFFFGSAPVLVGPQFGAGQGNCRLVKVYPLFLYHHWHVADKSMNRADVFADDT